MLPCVSEAARYREAASVACASMKQPVSEQLLLLRQRSRYREAATKCQLCRCAGYRGAKVTCASVRVGGRKQLQ